MFQGRAVAGDPVDVVDVGDTPDLAHDLFDVLHATSPEREPAEGRPVLDGVHPGGEDVHPGVGDGLGYIAEQVRPVQRLDHELDGEELAPAHGPLDLDEPLWAPRLQSPGVGTGCSVDGDTTSQRDVTDDVVPGHRRAAAGEPGQDAARADDPHPRLIVRPGLWERERHQRRALRWRLLLRLDTLGDAVNDVLRR